MTTATKITLFRVVMIPVFLVCMYLSEIWSWMQIVSCVVFAVASLSDILDGQIARRCNQVTDGIRQQLAQELKNGLELRPSKKVGAGFRLAAKDRSGYFDCSDQEIAEMLMPFFRDMHL